MKKNGKTKSNQNGKPPLKVRVEFINSTAKSVAIAGTFNDWRPEATDMVAVGDGRWIKDLVLPVGQYEYLLVADGRWMPDPTTKISVPNPFGGVNSVMEVQSTESG